MERFDPKPLVALTAFFNKHWALCELFFTASLYAYTFRGVVRRSKQRIDGQLKRFPLIPFLVHVTIGIVEVFRYQVLALRGEPTADLFDCVVGVTFAISSFRLSNTIVVGNTSLVRSTYQAMALLHLVASVGAYTYGNNQLHRAVVKNYHQFLYLRHMIRRVMTLRLIRNYHDAYAMCVVLSCCVALSDGGFRYSIPTYFFLTGAFAALDHWVSDKIAKTSNHNIFLDGLVKIGLCDIETFRAFHGQAPPGGYSGKPEHVVVPDKTR